VFRTIIVCQLVHSDAALHLMLGRHHGLSQHALVRRGCGTPQRLRLLPRVRVLTVLPAPTPDLLPDQQYHP